jgi:hypothetical protein
LIPRAISLISSRPGGPADLAAVVVLRDPGQNAAEGEGMEYRLRLVDLAPAADGEARVRKEVRLWPFSPEPPSLAASADGRRLAVAGNASRTIVLFEVTDLLRGETKPQLLRGLGSPIGDVAFVQKGEVWGLRLDPTPPQRIGDPLRPPQDGSVVLDPAQHRLSSDLEGWNPRIADPAGWTLRLSPDGREGQGNPGGPWVEYHRADEAPKRIELRPGHELTAVSLLPPMAPLDSPLVAIASERSGEPSLALYEGNSGERFRQLTGHTGRITALRFSTDGRLLASASADRTACVWSLIDADRTIGLRGRLPGVAVTDRDGQLVVTEVEPNSDATGRLEGGDLLLGLVRGEQLTEADSLFTFYNQISMIRPGEVANLRVRRPGEADRNVELTVAQAVDERKPLVSLFVARGAEQQESGWIAWNPLGPYDSSGQDVERLIGWHFNTGEPSSPTRFAQADQFLEFRREGLVGSLLEQAALPPRAAAAPLSPPELGIVLDVPEEGTVAPPIVRRRPSTLRLVLLDEAVTSDQVSRVEWQLDNSPAVEMTPEGPSGWTTSLDGIPWDRGVHSFRVSLHTREAIPQVFETVRQIQYVPPAPRVVIDGPPQRVVDRPELTFRASVEPLAGPATVRMVHRLGEEVRAERSWQSADLISIAERIVLGDGVNTIHLIAVNDQAIEGLESEETTDLNPVVVVYNRRQVPPPTVDLTSVAPLIDGDPLAPIEVDDRAIMVESRRIAISASLASVEPVDRVEWRRGDGDWSPVALIDDPPDLLRFEVELEPGPNLIRFRAKSTDSEFAEALLTLSYRPRVPEVVDLTTGLTGPVLNVAPDQAPPRIQLSGRFIPIDDPSPFTAAILLNGQPLSQAPELDAEAKTFSAEIPLRPGENSIRVRFHNAWGASWSSDPVVVSYRRPPKILRVEHSGPGIEPVIDVTASILSPPELPVLRAAFRVEGSDPGVPDRLVEELSIESGDDGTWTIAANRVPITPGENSMTLLVWNADGQSPDPGRLAGIVFETPPPPPPRIIILRPGRDATERVDHAEVAFEVHSDDPLRAVRLVRVRTDAEHETLIDADPAGSRRTEGGGLILSTAGTIMLEPGANLLRVEAETVRGSLESVDVNLSYITPPVRVEVVSIASKERGGTVVHPVEGPDNRVSFSSPVGSGQGWLTGRVVWSDQESLRRHQATRARIWVNRFPQSQVRLRPVEGNTLVQEFRAEVIFSRKENEVGVELPGVPLDEVDRPSFLVSCDAPEDRQRLHLLVVGVGQRDRDALRSRALEAMLAEPHPDAPEDPDRFQTPAFLDGVVYGPLHDDVRIMELVYQLDRIRREVNLGLTLGDRPIDVVAVYLQGNAWVEGGHAYFGLRRGQGRGRPESVSLDFLADQFAETRGFQLFLIDAQRPIEAEATPITQVVGDYPPDRWPPSDHVHHVGILNQTWWHDTGIQIPEEPGRDATLTSSLELALSSRDRLDDVATFLRQGLDRLRLRFENITLEEHLPEPLLDLNLGRPIPRTSDAAID